MATLRKQYHGIKFPFTNDQDNGFFLDLNTDLKSKTESEIAHVMLTPKGARIRMPEFGTNLPHYLFDANHSMTWDDVKNEVMESIVKYVPNVNIDNIEVLMNEEDENVAGIYVAYSVGMGNYSETNEFEIYL